MLAIVIVYKIKDHSKIFATINCFEDEALYSDSKGRKLWYCQVLYSMGILLEGSYQWLMTLTRITL